MTWQVDLTERADGTPPDDELYRIDPGSGAATFVADLDGYEGVAALDLDEASGVLYGWDSGAGLITIDPDTGAVADVNPSVAGPSMTALVVLPDGSLVAGQHTLHAVDPDTGEATEIGGSLNNVRGLDLR